MTTLYQTIGKWFGWGGAMGENTGQQTGSPSGSLIAGSSALSTDAALQLGIVWACIDKRANIVAGLPFFAYKEREGEKSLARTSRLYSLLKDSPNSRMTPFEFWRAMMMNYDLRGNAYARIDRDTETGEAIAMWPMPAEQVRAIVLPNGSMIYEYTIGGETAVLSDDNVLHLKNLGNGTIGLTKLDFMSATTDEMTNAQISTTKMFANGGKPTAVLMVDGALTPAQREGFRTMYGELASGSTSRLAVLEANMKYQTLSLSAQEQQLLEARNRGAEEICGWFDIPPILVNRPSQIKYGNDDIIEDIFYKLAIAPLLKNIEQAFRKRVMTSKQRSSMVCEFGMDALLRGSAMKRAEIHAKALQNGWLTRAEVRQLEGWPRIEGTDELTAQSNLVPLSMLGKTPPASGGSGADIAQ